MVLYFGKAKLRIVDAVKIIPVSIDILTKTRAKSNNKKYKNAAVVKLADAPDSKSGGLILRVGSSPTSGTKKMKVANAAFFFVLPRTGREPKVRAKPCVAKAEQRPTSGTKCDGL